MSDLTTSPAGDTFTTEELFLGFIEWETRRRLRPSTFVDPRDEILSTDVDENARRSVDFLRELIEGTRPASREVGADLGATTGEPGRRSVTFTGCIERADESIERGDVERADAYRRLAETLR